MGANTGPFSRDKSESGSPWSCGYAFAGVKSFLQELFLARIPGRLVTLCVYLCQYIVLHVLKNHLLSRLYLGSSFFVIRRTFILHVR